jgi:hypothetical protein
MVIDELLEMLADGRLAVPSFQRHYEWSRKKARKLMTSLLGGYTCGTLVLWRPSDRSLTPVRGVSADNWTDLILDGHQRLATLYMLVRGSVPPTCDHDKIRYDPRDMAIDLSTGKFSYRERARTSHDTWMTVADCFSSPYSEIMSRVAEEIQEEAAKVVRSLYGIRDLTYPIERVSMAHDVAKETYDPQNR